MEVAIESRLVELGRELGPQQRVMRNVRLGPFTTFKIGGPADLFCIARSSAELARAVRLARAYDVPYLVLGTGANILVGDGGYRGLVIKNEARSVELLADGGVRVESGAGMADLINTTAEQGLSGLEHFAGIPSSVGGALWQNLHFLAPDRQRTVYIAECLVGARILDEDGAMQDVSTDYFQFGYDDSVLHHRKEVALSALFNLRPSSRQAIERVVAANLQWRRERHPDLASFPSAGSIFKKIEGVGAGRLIDQCGLKGLIVGAAQVSPRHANFIVNLGGASCRDVLSIVRLCQERVRSRFGLDLHMEVGVVGAI